MDATGSTTSTTSSLPESSSSRPALSHETMKAVLFEGNLHQMAVRSIPRPTLLNPEDAIVRLTSAAICGTDLHTYNGTLGSFTPPWIMGHEGIGVVTEVGPATEHVRVGDRVLVPGGVDSGFYTVESSLTRTKEQQPGFGLGTDLGLEGGTQAEYIRVPQADDSLIKIPDDDGSSPDTDWLFLSDIFPTAWAGLNFAGFEPGHSVAVFGCGPVGLMCIYAASLRGASTIFAVDHVPQRLDKAKKLGAIPINFSEGAASQQILKIRPEGVNCSVDCVGQEMSLNEKLAPQQNYVLNECIRVTSFGGGVGVLGVYAVLPDTAGTPRGSTLSPELGLILPEIWLKNVALKGGNVFEVYWDELPKLFELVRQKKAELGWVVSARVGIEEAPSMYGRFHERKETKVVIEFPWRDSCSSVINEASAASKEDADRKKSIRIPARFGRRG